MFACVEINSTFHRSHRASTYARWKASTPPHFRFSVKVSKTITHERALAPSPSAFEAFLDEVRSLGDKLGPLLFQLPPRQDFDGPRARAFLSLFRDLYPDGAAALEPRHPNWFSPDANSILREFRVARVVADPPRTLQGEEAGGDTELIYYRLHGSPRVYYSGYTKEWLGALSAKLSAQQCGGIWCIFDNTASGAALGNAMTLTNFLLED